VNHRMALVKNEIARFHGDIDGNSIVSNHFQRPRLVGILIDINDGARDQGQTVHVGSKNRTAKNSRIKDETYVSTPFKRQSNGVATVCVLTLPRKPEYRRDYIPPNFARSIPQ